MLLIDAATMMLRMFLSRHALMLLCCRYYADYSLLFDQLITAFSITPFMSTSLIFAAVCYFSLAAPCDMTMREFYTRMPACQRHILLFFC